MEKVKRSLLFGDNKQHVLNGQHEFPPRKDRMVKSYNTNQTDWYESSYWIYAWFPFRQYGKSCQLSNFACIHCKEKELESHQYVYRPMFSFDKTYYCYHRRVRCKSCLKNFAEIDPRFLPQFPTIILERFKFTTTVRGYGIDLMMLYHFANLHPAGSCLG